MGRETHPKIRDGLRDLPKVQDGSADLLGSSEQVGRSSGRSGTRLEVLPGSVTGQGNLSEIWDRCRGTSEGPRRVLRSSGRYGTCRGTLLEVRDGSGDPPGCSWTGWGIIKEVRDWSWEPPKGLGQVWRSFGRTEIGWEVLRKVGD